MTAPLREPPPAAVHASRTTPLIERPMVRALLIATLVGGFLSFLGVHTAVRVGVFGRILENLVISWVAVAMGYGIGVLTDRLKWAKDRSMREAAVGAVLMTVPMGLFVWGIDKIFAAPPPKVSDIPGYILVSFVISAFFNIMVYGLRRRQTVVIHAERPAPKFLERLPLKLRGAEVWAVEAEDHYLRLHTSKGQDLILMRLADAVAELEGIEGAQVHRSWWVARDAITGARRGDGRATLTLKDGAEVPVSRTYAAQLRERRWI